MDKEEDKDHSREVGLEKQKAKEGPYVCLVWGVWGHFEETLPHQIGIKAKQAFDAKHKLPVFLAATNVRGCNAFSLTDIKQCLGCKCGFGGISAVGPIPLSRHRNGHHKVRQVMVIIMITLMITMVTIDYHQ